MSEEKEGVDCFSAFPMPLNPRPPIHVEINFPFMAREGIRVCGQRVFDLVLKEYSTEGKRLEMKQ